ncbi:MAG: hypothetical protein ABSH21_10170 [Verrucomicrobiia bacterium]
MQFRYRGSRRESAVAQLSTLGIITHTQKCENIQNNRVGWDGNYDSLEFSRVDYVEEGIGGVFFRQMVVGLVSVIPCLAGVYHYRIRQLL